MPSDNAPLPDPRAFRDALGRYATGVTVVTIHTDAGPLAMTANSFASVSMDPPLVLWSPARSSTRHNAFVDANRFRIHVLAECQAALAQQIARDGRNFPPDARFETALHGPALPGCSAWFNCRRTEVFAGGDHSIILARVDEFGTTAAPPLAFLNGRYGCFA